MDKEHQKCEGYTSTAAQEPNIELSEELLAVLSIFAQKKPTEIDEFSRELRDAISTCRSMRGGKKSTQYGTIDIKGPK